MTNWKGMVCMISPLVDPFVLQLQYLPHVCCSKGMWCIDMSGILKNCIVKSALQHSLCSVYQTVCSLKGIMSSEQCTLYTVHCTLYSDFCRGQLTLQYSVQCDQDAVHCTFYSDFCHCPAYTIGKCAVSDAMLKYFRSRIVRSVISALCKFRSNEILQWYGKKYCILRGSLQQIYLF